MTEMSKEKDKKSYTQENRDHIKNVIKFSIDFIHRKKVKKIYRRELLYEYYQQKHSLDCWQENLICVCNKTWFATKKTRKEKNLDAILHISLTPYMHYMLHNYSIVTCRTFVIKQRWRRSGIKMIKVAEGKKMATTRHRVHVKENSSCGIITSLL